MPIIVACTAYVSSEEKNKCQSIGMQGFINKPINFVDLQKVLNKHLLADKNFISNIKINS